MSALFSFIYLFSEAELFLNWTRSFWWLSLQAYLKFRLSEFLSDLILSLRA